MKESIEIFFCYAREDEELRQGLEKQLRALRRQGIINVWHDRKIAPGDDWEHEIDTHLNSADIILLLISPDFMDSDYCYGKEMIRAMERHNRGEARVIPVIVRHVHWQKSPFGKIQALPTDGIPVTDPSWNRLDIAFYNIAEGIRVVAEAFIEKNMIEKVEENAKRLAEERARKLAEEEQLNINQAFDDLEGLALLRKQEQMMTAALAGALPEQPDIARFKNVLDVGSGTGAWLIEVAQTYPEIAYLVGIDINPQLVAYAQAQAKAQRVANRVQFRVMNAVDFLDFSPNTFDLINQRFGTAFLRLWEWNELLENFRRIAHPHGVIRLIEADMIESNSSAQMQQADFLLQAFHRSGHAFTPQKDGMTSELIPLLLRHRFQKVKTANKTLYYHKETLEGQFISAYLKQVSQSFKPFMHKWIRQPNEEMLNKQILEDMEQPNFEARWKFVTIWANNSSEV